MIQFAYTRLILAALLIAARRSASSFSIDSAAWFWGLGVVAVIVVAILVAYAIGKAVDAKKDARADAQYREWLAALQRSGGDLPEREAPIHLKKGEACYFADPTATLLEPRAVRSGGFGGGSVRVAKGISIHTGRITSESHDEWRRITTGALYVTNKRIIFDGATKNRTVEISDVMSVERGYRYAMVNSHALQRPLAFGSINGQIFATVVDTIADQGDS